MKSIFWQGKRVLITGHTGFKGTWLTLVLKELGANVVGLSNGILPGTSLFSLISPPCESIWSDICDVKKLKQTIEENGIEYVFHLAAQSIVRIGFEDPFETFRVNTLGGAAVLEAVKECSSVRGILYVTTDKVYRNSGDTKDYAEDSHVWGASPYAASKGCADMVADAYLQSYWQDKRPLGVAVVRAGNVLGGGDFAPDRLVPDCVRAAQSGTVLRLRHPLAVRPYQFVLDVLFAYLELLYAVCEHPEKNGAYNVGPHRGNHCTSKQLVEMFFDALQLHRSGYIIDSPPVWKEDECLMINSEKLQKSIGFIPSYNIRETVYKTAQWYRKWLLSENVFECCEMQIRDYLLERY